MEAKDFSRKTTKTFLGKKTSKINKSEENYKTDETYNSSAVIDATFELSFDNFISLGEKPIIKNKIPGFDDIKIPTFLNNFSANPKAKKTLKNYNKIKEDLGSPELEELYLIDIRKIIAQ